MSIKISTYNSFGFGFFQLYWKNWWYYFDSRYKFKRVEKDTNIASYKKIAFFKILK